MPGSRTSTVPSRGLATTLLPSTGGETPSGGVGSSESSGGATPCTTERTRLLKRVRDQQSPAVLRDRARLGELRQLGVAAVAGEAGRAVPASVRIVPSTPTRRMRWPAESAIGDRAVGERRDALRRVQQRLAGRSAVAAEAGRPAPTTVAIVPPAVDAADAVVARVGDQEAAAGERRDVAWAR